MQTRHFAFWPPRLAKTLTVPETTLYNNLEITAKKYPDKVAVQYYGGDITYARLLAQVEKLAGYLENDLRIEKSEKVLLFMQNSSQFVIGYFAILRIQAVVVPINPMSTGEDLAFYVNDCNIEKALVSQELVDKVIPLKEETLLKTIIVAAYSDYIVAKNALGTLPEAVTAPAEDVPKVITWKTALAAGSPPSAYEGAVDDLAMIPYTSGTTGLPKGCMHTNRTIQANTIGSFYWGSLMPDAVVLGTLPLFHVTGLIHSVLAPILAGSKIVLLTRWNRDYAAEAVETYKCTHWTNISTMLIDFLANPRLKDYDISSLEYIGGGGAPLPEAVGEQLYERTGLRYAEGYGLTETISQTHFNPPHRPKLQCLGIPSFEVDSRIIDTATEAELDEIGMEGELVVNGPQVFKGYYNRKDANQEAFLEIDGKSFFRTGDIVRMDEEGYYFLVDRLKRMINAAGFKVWPTEVENMLFKHPAVQQACVVRAPDKKRGETVKAFVILNDEYDGKITEDEIIEWSKGQMAAYKYPRIVQFTDHLMT